MPQIQRGPRHLADTSPLESPAAEPGPSTTLDAALVAGIAWTGGMRWTSQILSWIATLVVARLLSPTDYGLVGMATIYLGLISLLSEFGIGAAIVVLRDLTDEQVAQSNTLSLMFGIAAFLISCAAAVPLGWFFRQPQLPSVIVALSLAFIITALRTVPYALLQRELRFKRLALIDAGQAVLTAGVMVALANLGFRYWTLVLGGLLSALISTSVVVASRPQRFAWPRLQSMRRAVTFSWYVLLDRLAWYAYTAADLLVAGRVLGRSALGAYSIASTVANLPTEKITALVGNVTPSIFSAAQTDLVALRRYLLSVTEGLALITLPATVGLAFVARDFVLIVLGERWRAVIAPLHLLAAYAAVRSLTPVPAQLLTCTGEARFVMRTSLVGVVLLPLAFWIGSRWGTVGIAAGWIVAHPLVTAPVYWRAFRKFGVPVRQYLRAIWPAISGVLFMLAAMWTLDQLVPRDWPRPLQLGLQLMTGIVAYLAALLALRRDRLRRFYQTWKLASG